MDISSYHLYEKDKIFEWKYFEFNAKLIFNCQDLKYKLKQKNKKKKN